jgi:membrane-bound lytic murein transglycosylase B
MLRSVLARISLLLFLIMMGWSSYALAEEAFIERQDVKDFIELMVKKHNFNKEDLVKLFNQVKVRPQVISQMSKPLEKEPWRLYQMLFVNEWRIKHGVEFWDKYKEALDRAEKTFGVPASIIVATIGIETRYGQKTGEHRVMDALSNLAFTDGRRAGFFKKELTEFLLLTREQKLDPMSVMGSYAGAIGQPQFMPSSYRYYAINFSGTGTIDLMNDEVDVIGSIANYYKKHGWAINQPIAMQAAIIPNQYTYMMRNSPSNQTLKVADLSKYGIFPKTKISQSQLPVKIIQLDNRYSKEVWLGFPNFDVIKRYNQSDLYAMAVYQLSYYINALRVEMKKG